MQEVLTGYDVREKLADGRVGTSAHAPGKGPGDPAREAVCEDILLDAFSR